MAAGMIVVEIESESESVTTIDEAAALRERKNTGLFCMLSCMTDSYAA